MIRTGEVTSIHGPVVPINLRCVASVPRHPKQEVNATKCKFTNTMTPVNSKVPIRRFQLGSGQTWTKAQRTETARNENKKQPWWVWSPRSKHWRQTTMPRGSYRSRGHLQTSTVIREPPAWCSFSIASFVTSEPQIGRWLANLTVNDLIQININQWLMLAAKRTLQTQPRRVLSAEVLLASGAWMQRNGRLVNARQLAHQQRLQQLQRAQQRQLLQVKSIIVTNCFLGLQNQQIQYQTWVSGKMLMDDMSLSQIKKPELH